MPNRYDNTGRIDFDWQTIRDHAGQGPCRYWIPLSNGLKPDERVPRSSNPDAVMGDRRLAVRSRLRCHWPAELRYAAGPVRTGLEGPPVGQCGDRRPERTLDPAPHLGLPARFRQRTCHRRAQHPRPGAGSCNGARLPSPAPKAEAGRIDVRAFGCAESRSPWHEAEFHFSDPQLLEFGRYRFDLAALEAYLEFDFRKRGYVAPNVETQPFVVLPVESFRPEYVEFRCSDQDVFLYLILVEVDRDQHQVVVACHVG